MKKIIFIIILSILLVVPLFCLDRKNAEIDAIEEVVQIAFDAYYNDGDIELIKKYFHPGFNLLSMTRDNSLLYYFRHNFIDRVKQQKERGKYPPKKRVSIKFLFIDVVGNAAAVKQDFYRGERRTCTDFLLLYKFKEGWRLVSWTTYHHSEK